MPLTSSATKLAAVVQCVMRTSAECRTLTFYANPKSQIPKPKSQAEDWLQWRRFYGSCSIGGMRCEQTSQDLPSL